MAKTSDDPAQCVDVSEKRSVSGHKRASDVFHFSAEPYIHIASEMGFRFRFGAMISAFTPPPAEKMRRFEDTYTQRICSEETDKSVIADRHTIPNGKFPLSVAVAVWGWITDH